MEQTVKCKKCNKSFSTSYSLERHLKKGIPCDKIIRCEKCLKVFKHKGDLSKHEKRKTPCEPIQGDPTKPTPKNTCHFCGKLMSNKRSVRRHFNTCKIKNGGMMLLFEKVKRLEEKVKAQDDEIKTLKTPGQIVNGNVDASIDSSNHHNTQININFINWDDNNDSIKKILAEHLPRILAAPRQDDIPFVQQVSDRVSNLVGIVFRNPEYKELQGLYVVDLAKTHDNAFTYNDDKWVITNWDDLRSNMLQKLYTCKPRTKEGQDDVLDIIKYLFVLGKCGDCKSIKRLSDEETLRIYSGIASQLGYSSIME
jgi:hypothetical protein